MIFRILFPTVLVIFGGLSGCASPFMNEDSESGITYTGSEMTSNSGPLRAYSDFNSDDYRRTTINRAIETHDIVPGMSPRDVIASWGRPRDIETAGESPSNQVEGNRYERWLYYSGNSLRYEISPVKMIYFEGGSVIGWETAQSR